LSDGRSEDIFREKDTFKQTKAVSYGKPRFFFLYFCVPPKHHSGDIQLKAFAILDIIPFDWLKHVASTAIHFYIIPTTTEREKNNRLTHTVMIISKKKYYLRFLIFEISKYSKTSITI